MSNFKAWAKDVALRAVKTAAQAAGAVITANTAGLTHVPVGTVADVAGLAALICVLQNLASLKVPDPAADPTQPVPLPGGVGPGRLAGYGDTSSGSSSHPAKEGPNT